MLRSRSETEIVTLVGELGVLLKVNLLLLAGHGVPLGAVDAVPVVEPDLVEKEENNTGASTANKNSVAVVVVREVVLAVNVGGSDVGDLSCHVVQSRSDSTSSTRASVTRG